MLDIPLYFSIPLVIFMFMCLYRIARGPTLADRIMGIDFLTMILIGYCTLLAYYTNRPFLLDISIVLAIFNFIGTVVFSKYLENKKLDK